MSSTMTHRHWHDDERGATWWEGYWACCVGWPLHQGASVPYAAGWRHRHRLELEK